MRKIGLRKTYIIILVIALITSIAINLIFTFFFIQKNKEITSYKGTWKCSSSDPIFTTNTEITLYVDRKGFFYESLSENRKIYQVYKGHIEENTIIYQGMYNIQRDDHYDYLSDIPDEIYEEINYFYLIDRTSSNTLTINHANEKFIRVDTN